MKTLLLLRHAKLDQDDRHVKERQRPLTKKGERRAGEIGHWLKARELLPVLILSSSSVRACRTAELVAAASGYVGEVRLLDELYMAEADEILAVLRLLPDDLERVLVVGHNPGLESLIPMLTEQVVGLPLAGLADISLPVSAWGELKPKTHGDLIELWRPKEVESIQEEAGGKKTE
ncbi:MAG TPA: histidine phosphatase family protein [Anaerolineaceae bacterium]